MKGTQVLSPYENNICTYNSPRIYASRYILEIITYYTSRYCSNPGKLHADLYQSTTGLLYKYGISYRWEHHTAHI
jgi:hypothetical protein